MTVLQIILSILGTCGGVLVVVFTLWGDVIKLKLNRKFTLEDRKMAQNDTYSDLQKTVEDFISAQKAENRELRQRLSGLERTMHIVNKSTKSLVYNDIRRDALVCIKQGSIDPVTRAAIKGRWKDYIDDYGEDHSLESIMLELDNLRATAKENV